MVQDTRTAILDEAEALFADKGYDATSLRMITSNAGANLAAVNYYYGSKEALLEAVYARRIGRINDERLSLLNAVEEQANGKPVSAEKLVEIFVKPPLQMTHEDDTGGENFIRLLGRSYLEPSRVLQDKVQLLYKEVTQRFNTAFAKSLPELSVEELYWRLHFMIGVLAYCMTGTDMMRMISSSNIEHSDDIDLLVGRLVRFVSHGLYADEVNADTGGLTKQAMYQTSPSAPNSGKV